MNKETLLTLETWIAFIMTLISVLFLVYDLVTHGLLFAGSLVPLTLACIFLVWNRRKERELRRLQHDGTRCQASANHWSKAARRLQASRRTSETMWR
jgi:hypothetical protein